jgi:hypothetical protein
MDPQLLNEISNFGYEPGGLTRLAETADLVLLSCRLTLFCSTFGFAGGDLSAGAGSLPEPSAVSVAATAPDLVPQATDSDAVVRFRPTLTEQRRDHPLMPVYRFATKRYAYIQPRLRDYECLVVLRERIDGELSDYQHVHMKVRSQQLQEGQVVTPYSVYINWLAPPDLAGRKVLYVAGWNNGKMRVRKGGGRFNYLKLNLSPFSETAVQQSHYPITEVGMVRVAGRLVRQIADDIRTDPFGVNTQVAVFKGAHVSGRPCTRIEVVHPAAWPGFIYHKANLFVDDTLHVPIRIEAYDWPDEETGEAELIEEYTYLKLRMNVGLDDEDFAPEVLN